MMSHSGRCSPYLADDVEKRHEAYQAEAEHEHRRLQYQKVRDIKSERRVAL